MEAKVRGVPILMDKSGNFQAVVKLQEGINTIEISALDIYHNTTEKQLTFIKNDNKTQISEFFQPSTNLKIGNYYALLIGNNNYQHVNPLITPINDVYKIGKILKTKYGFSIKIITDAKRYQILDAFNELHTRITPLDSLLIYYAGHGYFDEAAKKAYWLPIDARKDSTTQWIISDSITSEIKRSEARHIMVVADSCYSGALTRERSIRPTLKTRNRYIEKLLNRTSRTLMASGGKEPVLDEGGGGHSIFAGAFIKALDEAEESMFTAEDFFYNYLRETVAGSAEQVPEYSVIRNSGHNGGDFVFKIHESKNE